MVISYRAIYSLVERYYTPKSLDGIIKDCYQSFEQSISTAKQIEDYHYLNQMVTKKEENQEKFCFFWDYKHSLPTVLQKNVDGSVDMLANIYFDHKETIPKDEFISLIEITAENKCLDSKVYVERFNKVIEAKNTAYRLEHEKIQRNEQCPCGSGKKYKKCHGKI